MMTNTPPTTRAYHEIPNPQVLGAADQFRSGYELLVRQLPGTGALLPALHCASIAIELFLKSLSAKEVEVADSAFPGSAFIHARSAARVHKLEELYDLAPQDIRAEIEKTGRQTGALRRHASVRDTLVAHNAMFMASRYPYEAGQTFDGIEMRAERIAGGPQRRHPRG